MKQFYYCKVNKFSQTMTLIHSWSHTSSNTACSEHWHLLMTSKIYRSISHNISSHVWRAQIVPKYAFPSVNCGYFRSQKDTHLRQLTLSSLMTGNRPSERQKWMECGLEQTFALHNLHLPHITSHTTAGGRSLTGPRSRKSLEIWYYLDTCEVRSL